MKYLRLLSLIFKGTRLAHILHFPFHGQRLSVLQAFNSLLHTHQLVHLLLATTTQGSTHIVWLHSVFNSWDSVTLIRKLIAGGSASNMLWSNLLSNRGLYESCLSITENEHIFDRATISFGAPSLDSTEEELDSSSNVAVEIFEGADEESISLPSHSESDVERRPTASESLSSPKFESETEKLNEDAGSDIWSSQGSGAWTTESGKRQSGVLEIRGLTARLLADIRESIGDVDLSQNSNGPSPKKDFSASEQSPSLRVRREQILAGLSNMVSQ